VVKKAAAPVSKKTPPRNAVGKKSATAKTSKKKVVNNRTVYEATPAERIAAFGEEKVFILISEGAFYEDIAKLCDVSRHGLMRWLEANEDAYASAREARGHKIAEDILQIADDGRNDTFIDDNGRRQVDQDVLGRSRLRVDTRKWLASKMLPTIYGDRQILAGDPKAPLQVQHAVDLSKLSDEELAVLEKIQAKLNGGAK
jgi:hypothetical protein